MRVRSESYNPSSSSTCALKKAAIAATASSSTLATRVPKFLRCLYEILHTEDQTILSWSKDGLYFQIYDTTRLEDEILPKYFKHGKFASFQRQLNNFGFRKWTKTQSNVCTFSHHHFIKRDPQKLVELIISNNKNVDSNTKGRPRSASMGNNETNFCTLMPLSMPLATQPKRKRMETDEPEEKGPRKQSFSFDSWDQLHVQVPQAVDVPEKDQVCVEQKLLSKQQEPSFEFDSECWNLMADIANANWTEMRSNNDYETPTSEEVLFDFSLDDLDEILFGSSSANLSITPVYDPEEDKLSREMSMLDCTSPTTITTAVTASAWDLLVQDPELWLTN